MDSIRHACAVLTVIGYPPVLVFWLLVHPLIGFWRTVGPGLTYMATLAVLAGVGVALYAFRGAILATEYGASGPLIALSAVAMGLSVAIEVACRRKLDAATLVGVPELAAGGRPGRLLQDGVYARVRHPRYVSGAFGVIALALFTNYLAVYIIAAVYFPVIHLVTMLEENELADRFGEEYRRYARRVPRFIPRLRRSVEY